MVTCVGPWVLLGSVLAGWEGSEAELLKDSEMGVLMERSGLEVEASMTESGSEVGVLKVGFRGGAGVCSP